MTEHDLIGYIFMGTLGAFFLLGLPGFAIWRKFRPAGKPPEFGKTVGFGKVATWSIHPVDIVVAMGYIAMFVANWKMTGRMEETGTVRELDKWTVIGSTLITLSFASVIPFVMYWRVRPVEFFGLKWPQWRSIFLIVPCFLFGVLFLAAIVGLTGWPDFVKENFGGGLQDSVRVIQETRDLSLIAAMITATVIGAPIAEEIIFRGYLYPVAKKYTCQWFAILFTGVLFGVVHLNLMGFPQLALIGIVWAILYEKTGSLWVPIICHMAFNGMAVSYMLLSKFVPVP